MAQAKQHQAPFGPSTFVDLAKEAATSTVQTTIKTQQATESLVRKAVDTSLAAHEAYVKTAREYVGALFQAHTEWMVATAGVAARAFAADAE